ISGSVTGASSIRRADVAVHKVAKDANLSTDVSHGFALTFPLPEPLLHHHIYFLFFISNLCYNKCEKIRIEQVFDAFGRNEKNGKEKESTHIWRDYAPVKDSGVFKNCAGG
ncbi:hypothetical protein, partial [Brotaphodocola sp.]|uniref:hypothetical protein n=1 Tax=Brotaphodocola sp. TaxID=3073577 RepID=UPI003D7ED6DE